MAEDTCSDLQRTRICEQATLLNCVASTDDVERFLEDRDKDTLLVASKVFFFKIGVDHEEILFGSLPQTASALVVTLAGVNLPLLQYQSQYCGKQLAVLAYRIIATLDSLARSEKLLFLPPAWTCCYVDPICLEGLLLEWNNQLDWLFINAGSERGLEEEVAYWRTRRRDLQQLQTQLNTSPVVQRIQISQSVFSSNLQRIKNRVQEAATVAKETVAILSILEEKCAALQEIGNALPFVRLIITAQLVSKFSQLYCTHGNHILRKVTLHVVRTLSKHVPVDKVFQGFVLSSRRQLKQVLSACDLWKNSCKQVIASTNKASQMSMSKQIEENIFLHMDIFVQHLHDLLNVCSASEHLGGWKDGRQQVLPANGGKRSSQVTSQIQSLRARFSQALSHLHVCAASVLNVHSTTWYQQFQQFEAEKRQLEVATLNVLYGGFVGIESVKESLQLLSVFRYLANCQPMQKTMHTIAARVYSIFERELDAVGKELALERRTDEPALSGGALRAQSIRERIDSTAQLIARVSWLPECEEKLLVRYKYGQVCDSIQSYQKTLHKQWLAQLDKDKHMVDIPVLRRSLLLSPMLEMNIDRRTLRHSRETRLWSRLKMNVPVAGTPTPSPELLCRTRMMIQHHNRMVAWLSEEERYLLKPYLTKEVKQHLSAGFTTYTWLSPETLNFLDIMKRYSKQISRNISRFKRNNDFVQDESRKLSEINWICITTVESIDDWNSLQEKQREEQSAIVDEIRGRIENHMEKTFQTESGSFLSEYRKRVEDLIKSSHLTGIRNSLETLAENLRITRQPLFITRLLLDTVNGEKMLMFSMRSQDIRYAIECTVTALVNETEGLDETIEKIRNCLSVITNTMDSHILEWEPYRHLWEINLRQFIDNYGQPSLISIRNDISRYQLARYRLQQKLVHRKLTFILIDCSDVIAEVSDLCNQWLLALKNIQEAFVKVN